MAEVGLRKVHKAYGATVVVPELDLTVQDEEFLVLVGPSGCGKSTVLRMVAGLEALTGGEIRIGETVVNDLPPKDRDIAMVFQNYALYPHMTARENLAFGLKMRGLPAADIARRVREAAEVLDIVPLLERTPKQMSGGQRQRVAVGRAIVRQPKVFLFDEPLSNLDAKLRVQMRAELSRLQKRLRTTTIYVTHDQVEAMTMGHRIAVMKDGVIQQVAPPDEVYARPANLFVAGFIGSPPISILRARVAGDGASATTPALTVPLPPAAQRAAAAYRGREVLLGIRPECVSAAGDSRPGPALPFAAEVEVVEPLGREVIVHGRIGDDLLGAVLTSHRVPRLGERIDLALHLERLLLFDPTTGSLIN
jgi:multiple sugar transport system ATP-binding protein